MFDADGDVNGTSKPKNITMIKMMMVMTMMITMMAPSSDDGGPALQIITTSAIMINELFSGQKCPNNFVRPYAIVEMLAAVASPCNLPSSGNQKNESGSSSVSCWSPLQMHSYLL